MTPEEAKELNLTEFTFKHPHLSKAYDCILLADVNKGYSIKPYIVDEKEIENFIRDLAIAIEGSYGFAKMLYNRPDFCLAKIRAIEPADYLRETIKLGHFPEQGIVWDKVFSPSCPFA